MNKLLGMLLLAPLFLSACSSPRTQLSIYKPHFAALFQVPNLQGQVVVSQADKEVARANLTIAGSQATAQLHGLPANKELTVDIVWHSDEVLVARSIEPQTVRIKAGGTAQTVFEPNDYNFPDDDGDGASNLSEVVWATDNPTLAQGAHLDPDLLPPGFLTGLTGSIAGLGNTYGSDFLAGHDWLFSATAEFVYVDEQSFYFQEHRINKFVSQEGTRNSLAFDCPGVGMLSDLKVNPRAEFGQIAVACENQLYLFELVGETLSLVRQMGIQALESKLEYGVDGTRLYVMQPESNRILVLDTDPLSPTLGDEITRLEWPMLSGAFRPTDLVDLGSRLLVCDGGEGGILVFSHHSGADFSLEDHILRDELPGPQHLVVHPSQNRAYVTDNNLGELIVLDTSPADPADWSALDHVPIAGAFYDLVLDPVRGNWLYVLTDFSLSRLDVLNHAITWQEIFGEQSETALQSLDISSDGERGAIAVYAAQGLMLLGTPSPAHREREPNNAPSDMDGQANVLGPLPARRAGFCNIDDDGALGYNYWAIAESSPTPYYDDAEDLWLLEPGISQGRMALGIFATDNTYRMAITLFDESGQLLDFAAHPARAIILTPGVGTFLISDPIDQLPQTMFVGAALQDFDHSYSVGPYEIVALPLPEEIPIIDEVEPNNGSGQGQVIGMIPGVVHGLAEASDQGLHNAWGTEDVEDCYLVRTDGARIALRLEFEPDADLDLIIFDTSGVRIDNQYGLIGDGQTEFFVFEPNLSEPDFHYMACVTKIDSEASPSTEYSLTIIDFQM